MCSLMVLPADYPKFFEAKWLFPDNEDWQTDFRSWQLESDGIGNNSLDAIFNWVSDRLGVDFSYAAVVLLRELMSSSYNPDDDLNFMTWLTRIADKFRDLKHLWRADPDEWDCSGVSFIAHIVHGLLNPQNGTSELGPLAVANKWKDSGLISVKIAALSGSKSTLRFFGAGGLHEALKSCATQIEAAKARLMSGSNADSSSFNSLKGTLESSQRPGKVVNKKGVTSEGKEGSSNQQKSEAAVPLYQRQPNESQLDFAKRQAEHYAKMIGEIEKGGSFRGGNKGGYRGKGKGGSNSDAKQSSGNGQSASNSISNSSQSHQGSQGTQVQNAQSFSAGMATYFSLSDNHKVSDTSALYEVTDALTLDSWASSESKNNCGSSNLMSDISDILKFDNDRGCMKFENINETSYGGSAPMVDWVGPKTAKDDGCTRDLVGYEHAKEIIANCHCEILKRTTSVGVNGVTGLTRSEYVLRIPTRIPVYRMGPKGKSLGQFDGYVPVVRMIGIVPGNFPFLLSNHSTTRMEAHIDGKSGFMYWTTNRGRRITPCAYSNGIFTFPFNGYARGEKGASLYQMETMAAYRPTHPEPDTCIRTLSRYTKLQPRLPPIPIPIQNYSFSSNPNNHPKLPSAQLQCAVSTSNRFSSLSCSSEGIPSN